MTDEKRSYLISELKSVKYDEFASASSQINTVNKFNDKYAWNVTDSVIIQAKGNAPTSEWVATDNSITIVPN